MDADGYNDWRLTALTPLPALGDRARRARGGRRAVAARLARAAREPRRGAPRRRSLALRAVAALLAVFLLLEPAVELLQTARVRNRFAVLVDASRSMAFPVEPDGPSRRRGGGGRCWPTHRGGLERSPTAWTSSGTRSAATSRRRTRPRRRAGARPRRPHGRPRRARRRWPSGGGGSSRRLAGALVVSDGADNAALAEGLGPEARAELRALGVPVNAVAVGRSAPRDLAVERVAVDEFAFVRNTVTVEATLRAPRVRGRGGPARAAARGGGRRLRHGAARAGARPLHRPAHLRARRDRHVRLHRGGARCCRARR